MAEQQIFILFASWSVTKAGATYYDNDWFVARARLIAGRFLARVLGQAM